MEQAAKLPELTPEQKAVRREHYRKNKQVYKDKAKQWKRDNPTKMKALRYTENIKRYGISVEEYHKLYESQEGRCKICKAFIAPAGSGKKKTDTACIDHCHTTKKVRGLLCDHCNKGLGYFKDNPTALIQAAEYINDSTS